MKKIFSILCVALFTVGTTSAQSTFTLTGGINLANVAGEITDFIDTDMKVGFRIGGVGNIALSDYVSLRGGVLYSTKGAKIPNYYITDGVNTYYGELDVTLSYIEAPLGIEFSANDMISFHAGIYSAFLIGDTYDFEGVEVILFSDINGVDIGLDFGATFSVNDALSINAGYQYGFISLDDDPIAPLETYNSNIVIAMGYSFGGY